MKSNKLTAKQELFALEFTKTRNAQQAAMAVYNCKSRKVAASLASQLLDNMKVKAEIAKLLDMKNLNEDKIVEKISEGLEANVVANYKGDASETSIPDMDTRHKYVSTAVDVLGMKAPEKHLNVNVDIEFDSMSTQDLLKIAQDLTKQLKGNDV